MQYNINRLHLSLSDKTLFYNCIYLIQNNQHVRRAYAKNKYFHSSIGSRSVTIENPITILFTQISHEKIWSDYKQSIKTTKKNNKNKIQTKHIYNSLGEIIIINKQKIPIKLPMNHFAIL